MAFPFFPSSGTNGSDIILGESPYDPVLSILFYDTKRKLTVLSQSKSMQGVRQGLRERITRLHLYLLTTKHSHPNPSAPYL